VVRRPHRPGKRVVGILGEGASSDLLDVITRSEDDRAALIGRLSQRQDALWLAELLIEMETDPYDITRLRLIDTPHRALE
jgi:hypothetical protein